MSTQAIAAGLLIWFGMVAAISFLEAPLKFRAPGVTLPIGLGIGRLVFGALNRVEVLLAAGVAVAVLTRAELTAEVVAYLVAAGALGAQLLVVRPLLTRRTNAVLGGRPPTGPRVHLAYVALEVVKAAALLSGGLLALR